MKYYDKVMFRQELTKVLLKDCITDEEMYNRLLVALEYISEHLLMFQRGEDDNHD